MINAIIIDDERKLRDVLQIKLNRYCQEVNVLCQTSSASEAFEKINLLKPDLIFLDIDMPGASGFDLIDRFDNVDFEIIFVTGYNEYALDALKVSAVDYILKPVSTDSLIKAVSKAKDRIAKNEAVAKYEILKHNLNHIGHQDTKVSIPGSSAYDFVEVSDIIRCEGWQKYTKIYLSNGKVIVSSYNLGVFRDMLESYGFFSSHKSHLINNSHITRYMKDGSVIMSDESTAPVARRRKEEFMEKVVKHLSI